MLTVTHRVQQFSSNLASMEGLPTGPSTSNLGFGSLLGLPSSNQEFPVQFLTHIFRKMLSGRTKSHYQCNTNFQNWLFNFHPFISTSTHLRRAILWGIQSSEPVPCVSKLPFYHLYNEDYNDIYLMYLRME